MSDSGAIGLPLSQPDPRPEAAPPTADALPRPFWIAHRGMASVCPENTLQAYRATVAAGVDVVEPDCWLTSDGGLVCMHDSTVDRTTDGSGNTQDLTLTTAGALHVDAGTWFGQSWPNDLRIPTFAEVLDEFGGRAVLCPEAKNAGGGRALLEALTAFGALDTAIVQSFLCAELDPVIAAGGQSMMLTATEQYDPQSLHTMGVRYLALSAALPPSLVAPAAAAGLEVVVWVVDRRVDVAPWLTAGVAGVFSNDPVYVSGRSPVLRSDPFSQRTYYYGHLASSIAGDRGTFGDGGSWGYSSSADDYRGAVQGWGCPIQSADSYSLTLSLRMDGAATDGYASVFLAAADDRSFDDANRYHPGLNGYHVMLRPSGSIEVQVVSQGLAAPAGSASTAPIPAGETAELRIEVTPTRLTVTRADGMTGTVTIEDSRYRGGYFHLGRRAAAVSFSDVAVASSLFPPLHPQREDAMPTPDGTGPDAPSRGQELISIERARQLRAIPVQRDDDVHRAGSLAHLAAGYEEHGTELEPPADWAAGLDWKPQPSDIAALVRAGALYQAEIDRLQHRLRHVIARIDDARE